jgi:hypothetical protein
MIVWRIKPAQAGRNCGFVHPCRDALRYGDGKMEFERAERGGVDVFRSAKGLQQGAKRLPAQPACQRQAKPGTLLIQIQGLRTTSSRLTERLVCITSAYDTLSNTRYTITSPERASGSWTLSMILPFL